MSMRRTNSPNSLITDIFSVAFWQKSAVVTLITPDVRSNLLFTIIKRLKTQGLVMQPLTVPSTLDDMAQLEQTLSQSFLGASQSYVLPLNALPSAKVRQRFFKFLSTYSGPHGVYLLVSHELQDKILSQLGPKNKKEIHSLAHEVSLTSLYSLADLLGWQRAKKVAQALESQLPLEWPSYDRLFVLLTHLQVLPIKDLDAAFQHIIPLLPVSPSLTNISELFFRGEWRQFLTVWHGVYSDYSEMFWSAFWSDHIWRAFYISRFLRKSKAASNSSVIRSLSYRLSRQYVVRLWRQNKPSYLQNLFKQIYLFDVRLKNGSVFTLADLFLTTSFIDKK